MNSALHRRALRRAAKLRIKRPTFAEHSVAEFVSVIDGSFFGTRKVDTTLAYGQATYLGTLWMADLALASGGFYASAAPTLTGRVVDQATIVAEFADHTVQANANEAIHRFLPDPT